MVKIYISDNKWLYANNKFVEELDKMIYESLSKITKYNNW